MATLTSPITTQLLQQSAVWAEKYLSNFNDKDYNYDSIKRYYQQLINDETDSRLLTACHITSAEQLQTLLLTIA